MCCFVLQLYYKLITTTNHEQLTPNQLYSQLVTPPTTITHRQTKKYIPVLLCRITHYMFVWRWWMIFTHMYHYKSTEGIIFPHNYTFTSHYINTFQPCLFLSKRDLVKINIYWTYFFCFCGFSSYFAIISTTVIVEYFETGKRTLPCSWEIQNPYY